MAAFYGTIEGNRGPATRTSSKDWGIKAAAQSYDGSVITRLWYAKDGSLRVSIDIAKGESTSYRGETVFYGSLDELYNKLKK